SVSECVVLFLFLLFVCSRAHPRLPSFPTRRSSDLVISLRQPNQFRLFNLFLLPKEVVGHLPFFQASIDPGAGGDRRPPLGEGTKDRKSTRLNSSHVKISYAVFCLKKKKKQETKQTH